MTDNTCLEGLVGLRHLCDSEDTCMYVNDLPGIQMKSFANIANEEDVTAKRAFERIRREAMLQVKNDFFATLGKSVAVLDKIDTDIIGKFDTEDVKGGDGKYYGIEANKTCFDNELKVCIDWVNIYSFDALDIELNIDIDGNTSTKIVSLKKGENRIKISAVGYDVKVYFLSDAFTFADASGRSSCHSYCEDWMCYDFKYIESTDGNNFDKTNVSPFISCLSCKCDREGFLCHFADSLAYALRWKIAALLMEEIIYSERKSSFVRNSKNEARLMIANIYGGEDPETGFEKKSQYWKSINQAIQNTPLPDSMCIDCVGSKIVDSIP